MDSQLLMDNYRHHAPDEDKVKVHQAIRGNIYSAAEYINGNVPECREKSLAMTKLEEAMFWANAAVARNS